MPELLHDYGEYDNLIKQKMNLESMDNNHVYAKQYYDNLVVAF